MYTLLTAITDSFTNQFKKLLNEENIDIIVQSKYSASPISSSISQKDLQAIVSDKSISNYFTIAIGKKRYKDKSIIYLLGMNDFSKISNKLGINLIEGKTFSLGTNEILISDKLLNMKKLKIGDEIKLSNKDSFKIVGTFHSWISFFNSSIIGDLHKIRILMGKQNKTNMLFLNLKKDYNEKNTIEMINNNFDDLQAIKSSDFSQSLGSIKNLFYLSDIISILTLIIASAILINTFLIAMYERAKEIGILSTLGWSKTMIIYIFVVESVSLALLGGFLGFITSIGLLYYVQNTYTSISIYLPTSLNIINFFYTISISLIIGIVSVVLPAIYITKLSIAKVLHYE
jgi:putative ABC transport system permease protein